MKNFDARANVNRRVGIMQGRLSPRPLDRLQAFPHDTWAQEFELARELELDGIEWIFEAPRASENPLRSAEGRVKIRETIDRTGIPVLSVCGDYFMMHRLSDESTGSAASKILSEVISQTAAIGAKRILLPWLEEAALDTESKRNYAIDNLVRALPAAERHNIVLGLEMEIPGEEYRALLERINHPLVVAYYDTGNSTAQGLDVGQDILALRGRLGALHIKDRTAYGSSQFLGRGDTNFEELFAHLKSWNFSGDIVLQHYFEQPANDARAALGLVRKLWPKEHAA